MKYQTGTAEQVLLDALTRFAAQTGGAELHSVENLIAQIPEMASAVEACDWIPQVNSD